MNGRIQTSILLLILCGSIVIGAKGQTPSLEKWTRVDLGKGEVAISVPPGFMVDAEKHDGGQTFRIFAFLNGALMDVRVQKDSDAGNRLDRTDLLPGETGQAFTIAKVKGRQMSTTDPKAKYSHRIYLTSGDRFYTISMEAAQSAATVSKRFLSSLAVNGQYLFEPPPGGNGDEGLVLASSLATSPAIIQAFARKPDKGAFKTEFRKASEFIAPPFAAQSIRPAILVDRPYPIPSGGPSRDHMEANVVVNYLANGQIGDVVVYSDSGKAYASACADAVRKIKFVPAYDGDKPIDSVRVENYDVMVRAFLVGPVIRSVIRN